MFSCSAAGRWRRSRAWAAAACLLSAACGVLPQPFSHDGQVSNPLLSPDERAGIKVAAVKGTPHGRALAEAVARAFREADVAAQTGRGPSPGLTLVGQALESPGPRPSEARVQVLWRVLDADGALAGIEQQEWTVDARDWAAGAGPLIGRLARDAAAKLTPMVADPKGGAKSGTRQVIVRGVTGAPGDGRVSLLRSLVFELRKLGIRVSESPGGDGRTLVLAGDVKVAPAGGGAEGDRVEIVWTVLSPEGAVLGTVKQGNTVARGSLDKSWGVTAVFAARAAAPGIARILGRAPSEARR